MKFSEFFKLWVNDGYYANGAQIGKKGDFYTSVSVGWLFGATFANYFLRCLDGGEFSSQVAVVEVGANDGSMMADFIQGIFTLRPKILKMLKFAIVEPHERLRKVQQENIASRLGDEVKISWFPSFKECKFDEIFVVCNELFDSFACEVIDGENLLFIDKNFKPFWGRADDKNLKFYKSVGLEKGEISVGIGEFARELTDAARRIKFCAFDYGEWNFRQNFSLRVYQDHNVFNFFDIENLEEFFKTSDMTYDLCFSYLADEFKNAGFENSKFCRQNRALVEYFKIGEILNLVQAKADESVYKNVLKQLNFLTNPHFLGTKFKFIEFVKS